MKIFDLLQKVKQYECSVSRWNLMALLLILLLMSPAVLLPVSAQISSDPETLTTANSTLICPANIDDTIRHGGCNLKLSIGVPTFSTTTSLTMSEITISNNAPADSVYPVGETVVRWVAKSIYGDSIYCDQIVKVSFQPCPDAVDYEGTIYQSVRLGSNCKCCPDEEPEVNKVQRWSYYRQCDGLLLSRLSQHDRECEHLRPSV